MLVAALLGPSAAIVVLATVLIIQCFLFGDGGVLALGLEEEQPAAVHVELALGHGLLHLSHQL